MTAATGRCECGAVVYRVDGPLREILACHCTQCRRTSGHHSAYTSTEAEHVTFLCETGLRWYPSSSTAERGFCGVCGSNLFWRAFSDPGNLSIAAGTLDGPTGLRIGRHLFVTDRGDYYAIPSDETQCLGW